MIGTAGTATMKTKPREHGAIGSGFATWRKCLLSAGPIALVILGAPRPVEASFGFRTPPDHAGRMVQQVHSVHEAEETLYRRGYYDVRLERSTLPYSFNACRRGVRYHMHVDYYGDFVQVDPLGPCYGEDNGYYARRRYYGRYRYW